MTNNTTRLTMTCLLTGASCLAASPAKEIVGEKPNVLIIYADDIGYGDLSCYGFNRLQTPHVDKLAQKGIRFTNAHCSSATSTPSRFSFLTGMYAWRQAGTGIAPGDAALIINPDRYTFADMFKTAGYNTAVIGKWHLGLGDKTGTQDWNKTITPNPKDIGFDYSFLIPATGDRTPCIFVEDGLTVNLDPADPVLVSYKKNFEGEPTGAANPEMLRIMYTVGHNQSIVNGISRIGYMKGGKKAQWVDENIADVLCAKTISFLEKQKEENKPFFLYLATHDIHAPRAPHARFVGKSGMGARGDALLSFDWTVGQVTECLERLGMDKNTIIILSSDNGPILENGYVDHAKELVGDHKMAGDLRGQKSTIYEGGTRIPCILTWDGRVTPGVSDALMSQMDWFASFASLLNVHLPEGAAQDSQAQLASWTQAGVKGREYMVKYGIRSQYAITDGRWKYIPVFTPNGKEQLYDLSKDISESVNLATDQPAELQRLKQELETIQNQK